MAAAELSAELWQQRELLEELLFKFEEESLLLGSGISRWVTPAAREVEAVITRLQTSSLALSVAAHSAGEEWGLAPGAPLREVLAAAPDDGWRATLAAHFEALAELAAEVQAAQAAADSALRAGLRAVQESLHLIVDPAEYTAAGTTAASTPPRQQVDADA